MSNSSNSVSVNHTKSKSHHISLTNSHKEDIDDLVQSIMDPNVLPVSTDLCSLSQCKEKKSIVGTGKCFYCNKEYCMKHRQPESHSNVCTQKLREESRKSYQNQSKKIISVQKRRENQPELEKLVNRVGVVKAAEKETEEARKRLREKLKKSKSNR